MQEEPPRTKFGLIYLYAPLEENLLDVGPAGGKVVTTDNDDEGSNEGDGLLVPGCSKMGLWGMRYREEKTRHEFVRFRHRALDAAVVTCIYCMGNASTFFIKVSGVEEFVGKVGFAWFVVLFVVEMLLHFLKRGGTENKHHHAAIRQTIHNLAGLGVVWVSTWHVRLGSQQCVADTNYAMAHGGQEAGPTARYRTCVNNFHELNFFPPFMALVILQMDIHVHFGVNFLQCLFTLLAEHGIPIPLTATPGLEASFTPSVRATVIRVIVLVTAMMLSNLAAVAKHRFLQRGFETALDMTYQMRASKKRMETVESLMASMVPSSALGRLVGGKRVFDTAKEVTVLFSDMVSFTKWSSVRTPNQVVAMLSVMVRAFDVLAADMGVSKVKTIGDCYWAVAGVPTATWRHAVVIINFGLAMHTAARAEAKTHVEWDYPVEDGVATRVRHPVMFRTGIHSGPIQAGILGTQQISYEIFGETSTTANQLEASGHPDRVAVSARTKRLALEQGDALPFTFAPHSKTVPYQHEPDAEDDEQQGKLFLVTPTISEVEAASSIIVSCASGVSLLSGQQDGDLRAKQQRRKYLQSLQQEISDGGGDLVGDDASKDELIETFSAKAPTCCVSSKFATQGFEEDYIRFALVQTIGVRVAGTAALFLFLTMMFLFMLVDATKGYHISPLCLVLFLAGEGCMIASLCLSYQRSVRISQAPHDDGAIKVESAVTAPGILSDYLPFPLQTVGVVLWVFGAITGPDSLATNNLKFISILVSLTFTGWSGFIPRGPFLYTALPCFVAGFVNDYLRLSNVTMSVNVMVLSILFLYFNVTVIESRLRFQFVENRVSLHFAKQQAIASQAQEAVLRSMLPDFVIEPLTVWLASNFDPAKAVVRNYDETCVAFIRMSPHSHILLHSPPREDSTSPSPKPHTSPLRNNLFQSSTPIPDDSDEGDFPMEAGDIPVKKGSEEEEDSGAGDDDDGSADWLFEGHKAVDRILRTTKTIDKVKTVGDLVIVAGSFRGHSAVKAAAAMVSMSLRVHKTFDDETGQDCSDVTIGLHCGPVMGIVLGFSRLSFDIFGDTVNTTSRVMTSPIAKHKITASEDFVNLLPEAPFRVKHSNINSRATPTQLESVELGAWCEVTAKGKGVLRVREIHRMDASADGEGGGGTVIQPVATGENAD